MNLLAIQNALETIKHIEPTRATHSSDGVTYAKPKTTVTRDAKLLKFFEDNHVDGLDQVMYFLLNDFVVTHVATAKLTKFIDLKTERQLQTFDEYISFLMSEVTGTDENVLLIQNFIMTQPESTHEFLRQLASKTYKFGVSVKTYNKLAQKFGFKPAPEFLVQKALTLPDRLELLSKRNQRNAEKALVKGLTAPSPETITDMYVTEKFDGVRCIVFITPTSIDVYSRSGRVIEPLPEISYELRTLFPETAVLDGELLASNEQLKAEDTFRETMTIVGSKNIKKGLTLHVFDILTSPERFLSQTAQVPYRNRRKRLDTLASSINEKPHLSVAPLLYQGNNEDEMMSVYDEVINRGGEGVMINIGDSPYEFKRTAKLLKVKQVQENDGVVKDVYEGTGKLTGKLGGLIVTYKDKTVRIGGGFTDAERNKFFNDKSSIIGKVVTYQFTTESTNAKTNETDLRFGRYKCVRNDKTSKDVNYES